jgi:hypothetical protein
MEDPLVQSLPRSVFDWAPLTEVGHAIATTWRRKLTYVERRGAQYRWSPAHRGGPYPLLREVAKAIGVPHDSIVLPFMTIDGCAVLMAEGRPDAADALAWIDGISSLDPVEASAAIELALTEASQR